MTRTLLLSEVFPPKTGGSGRWFWEIYRRLPREVFLIVAGEDVNQESFDRTHDLQLLRWPLSFTTWGIASLSGARQYLGTARLLNQQVKKLGIQVLHCGKCLPEGMLAWLLKRWRGIPYICYVHGEELNLAAISRELRWLTRLVLNGSACVIANSRNTEDILTQEWGIPHNQIRLLHPGVDTNRFIPAKPDSEARRQLGWTDRTVVLTVGRLQKRKGHDHLILALRAVKQILPNVIYAIVGEGGERSILENLVTKESLHNYVQFLGEVGDDALVKCYQQCDLFVLPNRQVGQDIEGFGMVLLEAQACGKTVLAGASGGTAETMRIPETGQVVNCDDPSLLANAIIELLKAPERLQRMGAAGREWVANTFDWEVLSRETQAIFNAIGNDPASKHNLPMPMEAIP